MPKFLTSAQIAQYNEEGFLSPIDLMSEADAAKIVAQLEEVERLHPQHVNAENRNNAHLVLSFLDELAFNEIILDALLALASNRQSVILVLTINSPQKL